VRVSRFDVGEFRDGKNATRVRFDLDLGAKCGWTLQGQRARANVCVKSAANCASLPQWAYADEGIPYKNAGPKSMGPQRGERFGLFFRVRQRGRNYCTLMVMGDVCAAPAEGIAVTVIV
jgi:hypothetical protein